MLGDGLRFNNPYRLPRQLGTARESVSATATYLELAIGATTGAPDSITHGARLSWTVSLEGVAQQVVTPAYYAQYRFLPSWALFGWVGLPILLEPDVNLGGEFALGAAWFARAGLGVVLALVGDGFYGAGTRETKLPFYPVISGQLGIIINYEVLP